VITELTLAAMQGVAQALAERFIKGKATSAAIRSVVKDVEAVKELQTQDRASLDELKVLLALVLENADGLEVHRRKVVFVATRETPNVESALLNLDLEISKLRLGGVVAGTSRDSVQELQSRATDPSSIFFQLDEEIAHRRSSRGDHDNDL
jgi:hypothetical protein